jgi:phosphate transport system substrate-binding protein
MLSRLLLLPFSEIRIDCASFCLVFFMVFKINRKAGVFVGIALLITGGIVALNRASTDAPAFNSTIALNGAGATFPAPLYQAILYSLNQKHPEIQISYQSVGSGAGVKQFTEGTVDFGASDVEMTAKEVAKVKEPMLMLPLTGGSLVVAYNVPGVTDVKLSRAVYVDIFLGKIQSWSDPRIAKENPGTKFPNLPITVVHRSDGSGTTAVFTSHLSAINGEWQKTIGSGKSVEWPTNGAFIGAKGNEGVTSTIQQSAGSIGYIEYGFAVQNKLPMAILENKAGKFITATPESASAGLAAIELTADFRGSNSDPAGESAYPIVSYSRIMVRTCKEPANRLCPVGDRGRALEAMIEHALTEGQMMAPGLGYVPIPASTIANVAKAADAISPDYSITIK